MPKQVNTVWENLHPPICRCCMYCLQSLGITVTIVRRYSCTVYVAVVVCNVNSLYKTQEHRLSCCRLTALQSTTSCAKYTIFFGQIVILIFSQRGLGLWYHRHSRWYETYLRYGFFLPSLQIVQECASLMRSSSGFVASFHLKHDVKTDGMCYPARSLPFSMKMLVKIELKYLLAAGIIYPVTNPAVSAPIIPVVKQPGAVHPIRICGDYSLINSLIKSTDRLGFLHPTMHGGNYSQSKWSNCLLSSQSCWCISAGCLGSKKSTSYLYLNSPGAFRVYKNAIWNFAAPLIFQEATDLVLYDVPYVTSYQDNILIGAPSKKLHDLSLQEVK